MNHGPICQWPCWTLRRLGFDEHADRVIEVGIVICKYGILKSRNRWLVNPGRPIPAESTAVHGIKDADVASAPSFKAIAPAVTALMSRAIPAAYNAGV
jgi:DNA polymerase-3 subunit epsilon